MALIAAAPIFGQEPASGVVVAPADKTEKAAQGADAQDKSTEPQLPFQIQLLETHIRFEANGDSRKEVHTIVRLNNILGARQFSRIGFDYNRAFQQVEIPQVRISHANGGTSELLPSAVTDAPNPAVEKYPAYQDVRVKSVRILGLQEGDSVEYRVITTTTKPPLAPDFWLEHTFDRSGQVLEENYELNLPESRKVETYFSSFAPAVQKDRKDENGSGRSLLRWHFTADTSGNSARPEKLEPDIVLTSYASWEDFAAALGKQLLPNQEAVNALSAKAKEIAGGENPSQNWISPIYYFVSQKISTIDLPLGATGFRTRAPSEILSSGYATPEDKFALFAALIRNCCGVHAGFVHSGDSIAEGGMPRPSVFDHLLTMSGSFGVGTHIWMDLNLEVAPFGMIPSQFRSKAALLIEPELNQTWSQIPEQLPFRGFQKVAVDARLSETGDLAAKVKYTLRGDNELLLRVAFHQTPKEKWKDVAGLLAISDGFRGQVSSVTVSDPKATKDPFVVGYEISQPKFVDWTKKPVRVPALLPQIGLPDPPARNVAGTSKSKIELGTPLDVDTRLTLHLPSGTVVEAPAGTSVERDYATFSSKYVASTNTLTASRRVNFLAREIPGDRAADYNAFLRAVQNDQAQLFTLVPPTSSSTEPNAKPPASKP
jgi:hypothetical protein